MKNYDDHLTPEEERLLELINLEQTAVVEVPEDFEIKEVKK